MTPPRKNNSSKSSQKIDEIFDQAGGSGTVVGSTIKAITRKKGRPSHNKSTLLKTKRLKSSGSPKVKSHRTSSLSISNYQSVQNSGESQNSTIQVVDLRPIKRFVRLNKPDSALDKALSREPDELSIQLFLARLGLYLQIGEIEKKQ